MSEKKLTIEQAYRAMFYFLEREYELTKSDELGGMLGSLSWQIWEGRHGPCRSGRMARLAGSGAESGDDPIQRGIWFCIVPILRRTQVTAHCEATEMSMGIVRRLKEDERTLLTELIAGMPAAAHLLGFLADALVEEMNDGGMGSLRFCASNERPRRLSAQLTQREFVDVDGVPVMVAVNLDDRGELYELDVWKIDFSPLKRFPVVSK